MQLIWEKGAKMAEYIDRANLIARIEYYVTHTPEGKGEHYAYSVVLNEVINRPAADVAPVVSCKDCKYRVYKHINEELGDVGGCIVLNRVMANDDFCSYGERKDGGADND